MRRLSHPLATVLLGLVLAFSALEVGVRVAVPDLAPAGPAHDVLFLNPHPVVGWKHPENFEFLWNGRNPYCVEFSVQVTTNGFGFRDRAWTVAKPDGTVRIAFIGDSLIEGIQVPLVETAVRRVESHLAERFPDRRVETMNFGISNYGVGQYLMVYEQYVRRFQPDYVVVLAAYENFNRTTQPELTSRLQKFYTLNIRPSYRLDARGDLVYVSAADYEEYESGVRQIIDSRLGDDRTDTIAPLPAPHLAYLLVNRFSHKGRPRRVAPRTSAASFTDVDLNYRIIEALQRQLSEDGGRLVFVDAFDYFERYGTPRGSGVLVEVNRAFVESLGAAHLDVSPAFWASPANPQFECDMHLSPTGHRLLADSLVEWFSRQWRP